MELRPRTEGLPEGASEVPADAVAQAARTLARRLRSDGVLAVATPTLVQARPAGVDLVSALRVLLVQLADAWRGAAEALPVLDGDRLALHAASALLTQGADAAEPFTAGAERLDRQELGRAAALRAAVLAPEDGRTLEEGNTLLDRAWAVLTDVRRHAAGDGTEETVAAPRSSAVVPSAAHVDAEDARRLPPSLQESAATGALVGLLLPWLPPARLDPLARVDSLLNAVSVLARCHQDDAWWLTMTTVGRCTSQVAVAVAHAVATSQAPSDRATAGVLAEPAVARLVDEALAAAASLAPEAATTPAEGIGVPRAGGVPLPPQPSPSQQARAAAERAAAERAANQQAWMERMRTKVMGAGAPDAGAATPPETVTLPPSQPGPQRERDGADSDEPIHLGIWDTLMGPR